MTIPYGYCRQHTPLGVCPHRVENFMISLLVMRRIVLVAGRWRFAHTSETKIFRESAMENAPKNFFFFVATSIF
jgi:hypothetical protein